MLSNGSFRTVPRLVAQAAAAACLTVALLAPAYGQFWGWGNPRPQPRYQQQNNNPFGGGFFGQPEYRPAPREREAPVDYSHAPAPPRKQADAGAVTTPVLVLGDAMADWLAYGLEDAFAERPEFGIVRKHRTTSGLIRYEPRRDTEWSQVAREIITAEKPKFIVMMVGVNDRQSIRERAGAAAPARGAARGKAAAPAAAPAATTPPQSDAELQAQQSADQQNAEQQQGGEPAPDAPPAPEVAVPEPTRASSGNYEFRSEKWEAAYVKRIDATIAALKSANVPVLWVGLPAQRNSRASSDSAYLNELYRQRAEKAGIIYVDVWDGFVDDGGRYSNQGPDFEGQTRRLRSGDGVYFTKAGARKLAHYVEREIQRNIANRGVPIAMPAPEPAVLTPGTGARPSGPSSRPVAGPVVPLTASFNSSDELLGGGRAPRAATTDPVAVRVLTKGEPLTAPTGRSDDFSWPRNTVVTAEPGAQTPATAAAPAASAPAARTATTSPTTAPNVSDRARPRQNPPAASTQQRASNPDAATGTETAPPARRRARPPAAMTITPRDDVPRPPGLVGGR